VVELSGALIDPRFAPDVEVFLPGRTAGFAAPPVTGLATEFDSLLALQVPMAFGDDLQAGGAGPPAAAENDLGEVHPFKLATVGADWFEAIHITPRIKIEFGNIITQVDEDYEIFNAYRADDRTITLIVNNATPGVELPNVTPPVEIASLYSLLDPTSTFNHQLTSGLGVPVKTKVRATQDGLPTFDADITFAVTSNDVFLLVSGTRIVLIPFDYEVDFRERMSFKSDIIPLRAGKEQRISLRPNPRASFFPTYLLEGTDRRRMQALLFDWMDNVFGFPLKNEQLTLTAAVSPAATTYPVAGADDVDLRLGGLAVVIEDSFTFDVLEIQALSPTLITAVNASVNGYAAGTKIMPLRTARIVAPVVGSRAPNELASFQVSFEVDDNDTGALAGDTTPGFWSLLNGRVLLDDCNVVEGDMPERYTRRLFRVDNETGKVVQVSLWDRNKRLHQKGFVLRSRAEILQFRRLMVGLQGPQKAVWIPTFIEDLLPVADLVSAANTIDVESVDYTRLVRSRLPMTKFRITFTDDSSLVRDVTSSVKVSATVDRLTLDDTWPAARTVAEVVRIEFYELVRFESDDLELLHERDGLARVRAPLLRVFDDN